MRSRAEACVKPSLLFQGSGFTLKLPRKLQKEPINIS
jgi:hypothetical protein